MRLGAAAAGGQPHAAESEGCGHELEKLAAVNAINAGRTLGKLASDLGLEAFGGGELVKAAPVAGASQFALGGRGMFKFAFHQR